ncbi:outer membrane efflux protein [Natranaerovirga hydrolytica]|uniref:Outer membrane efflux protein n=1 Tax=Natranaerovirga hydrolytica TaxID=680378 RepID=A0A4R1MJY3_9FIRM|nr:TolC family protein [Natranaerovirga hydrolytica]TCK92775.1 outer membrane efflux protein [Natranaerovirga hydrolytica]
MKKIVTVALVALVLINTIFTPILHLQADESKYDREVYDVILNLETVKRMAVDSSNQSKEVEINFKRLEEGLKMAESGYKDAKDLEKNIGNIEDLIWTELRNTTREKVAKERELRDLLRGNVYFDIDLDTDLEMGEDIEYIEYILENLDIQGQAEELIFLLIELMALTQQEQLVGLLHSVVYELEIDEMFDGMSYEALQAINDLEHQKETAYLTWEKSGKALLEFQAEALYVSALSLQKSIEIQKNALDLTELMIKEQKIRLEQDMVTPIMVDMLELEKEQLELEILKLENSLESLKAELLKTVGLPLDRKVYLADIEIGYRKEADFEASLSNALNQGLEIEMQKRDIEFIKEQKEEAVSKGHISRNSSEYRMYELDIDEAYLTLDALKDSTRIAVKQSVNAFDENLRQLEIAKKGLALQEEALRGAKLQEELGMNTPLDVFEATINKAETEMMIQLAQYQMYLVEKELSLVENGFILQTGMANLQAN